MTRLSRIVSACILAFCLLCPAYGSDYPGMVRIAEIEVAPEQLDDYLAILKTEAEASVRLEPGVIAIFPMLIKDNPTSVRILEIYASRQAYEAHLKTPHFLHYKTSTLAMVKSLELVEMTTIDATAMAQLFSKLQSNQE